MHTSYDDILSRIPERPLWWLDGVPRYEHFSEKHRHTTADEVLLVETTCQHCNHRFDIAIFWHIPMGSEHPNSYRDWIELDRNIPYIGDPPNAPWCESATANSTQVRILEFWEQRREYAPSTIGGRHIVKSEWHRVPELEIKLEEEPLSWIKG